MAAGQYRLLPLAAWVMGVLGAVLVPLPLILEGTVASGARTTATVAVGILLLAGWRWQSGARLRNWLIAALSLTSLSVGSAFLSYYFIETRVADYDGKPVIRGDYTAQAERWCLDTYARPCADVDPTRITLDFGGKLSLIWTQRSVARSRHMLITSTVPTIPLATAALICIVEALGLLASGARRRQRRSRGRAKFETPGRFFDVFVSYSSSDAALALALAKCLKDAGLRVWIDQWELVPGLPWQNELAKIIRTVRSAVVLVGESGIGPWEEQEMGAFLNEFARRQVPVIPVLLPAAGEEPDLPPFLQAFTWVDLRDGFGEEGLKRLIWGIRGARERESSATSDAVVQ